MSRLNVKFQHLVPSQGPPSSPGRLVLPIEHRANRDHRPTVRKALTVATKAALDVKVEIGLTDFPGID
jgi:hypothetical protein